MNKNIRIPILSSSLVILTGLGFLWFGLNPPVDSPPLPISTPLVENIPTATSTAEVSGVEDERVVVTKVIDGDTIEVEGGKKVRLIGIDTPETKDPRRPVGCFGKEASNETSKLLSGKEVFLEKDISETDKYKRLLRYVFLSLEGEQLLFVNDYLIREGYAKVLTYPPDVKYNEQFRQAEKEAKVAKRGLWGRC